MGDPKREMKPRSVGIMGIERTFEKQARARGSDISAAFQDANSLINMAKPMVSVAKEISEKIKRQDGITEDETAEFRQHLLSLGISDPVTKSKFKSPSKYLENLAKEMCNYLGPIIENSGGMMSLVEAFCRWNRARGVDLASPSDLMNACLCLERLNLPLKLREFDSEVTVLQHISFDDDYCVVMAVSMFEQHDYLSAEEYSRIGNVPFLLAKHSLLLAEKKGKACRDDSQEGLRFYPNLFIE